MIGNVDEEATRLSKLINDRISKEWEDWSPYEFRARAEMVAEEVLGKDSAWEWRVMEAYGVPPQVIMLQYDPRKA